MRISTEVRSGVVIVNPKGNLMGAPETEDFRKIVKEHLEAGVTKFIIDLSDVKWMNSLGLGALISAYTSVKNKEGLMVITNVSDKVKSVFMITQLIKVFQNYDTVEDAIKAIAPEAL
jgi:anti-sigma B factor antagonist